MKKITREDLMSLEQYSDTRDEFRQKIMAHKKNRVISVGPNMRFHFEDRLLMQYQVQEMLRIEKIFDADGIQEELDAYNPLIPDGSNFKATFMIEYDDVEERKVALAKLIGVEDKVWVRVDGFDKSYAIADEDLERDTEEKTSSVHFMRFELSPEMAAAAKQGASIGAGVDHSECQFSFDVLPDGIRDSLVADLD